MPTSRLQQQFIRLWQHFQGQPAETTLQALAEILSCSRRHVRSLLNAMQQQGWLHWQAEAGRGRRSALTFLRTGLALQQQRAEELLDQGSVDQLVQLVGDKQAARQMLLAQLGRRFRQGRHLLRVLYYRPMFNLLPGSPMRRSETHLARQIFNGLTRINEENGELEPDLAHHWQALSPLHWRFYLRPAIPFHHGRPLEMEDVITSLTRVGGLPLFTHLRTVTSPTPHVIDIHLSMPDHQLPWLLGSVPAMILPREWPQLPDFARRPVGTGPYAMVHNRPAQLTIRAFDDYFGYRALIDEVSIWVQPELSEELVSQGVQLQSDDTAHGELESRLEEGCYFLLFDRRSPVAARPEVRAWLTDLLNPLALLHHTERLYQRYWSPASGLLPRWHHRTPDAPPAQPAGLTTLTLTCYRHHPEFAAIGRALLPVLAAAGITLTLREVSYETWVNGDAESDLWLGSVNFTQPLAFSLFAGLYELPLLRHCLEDDLPAAAEKWRAGELPPAEWCRSLVQRHQIHPLFHHWLQLQGQRSMRGVRMNSLGWFDFKSAWFAPPEP